MMNIDSWNARLGLVSASVLSLSMTLLTGCQSTDLARQTWAMREARVQRTVAQLWKSEVDGLKRLRWTEDTIRKTLKRDAATTRALPGRLDRRLQGEIRRWDKRRPEIKEYLHERILRGRPADIEPTAIRMFL